MSNKKSTILRYTAAITIFAAISIVYRLCLNPFTRITAQRVYYIDEVVFESIGKAWSEGIPLYTYYFDHKGPVLFLWFAISYRLARTYTGVSLLAAIWDTITSTLLYQIIYQFGWFQTNRGNHRNAVITTILLQTCKLIWRVNLSITVSTITMPFLLTCTLLLMHWYRTDSFDKPDWKHGLYGLMCMLTLLCRASDGIYIVLVYISIWLCSLKKRKITNNIKLPVICIVTGMIPFVIFSIYFMYYNVFSEFIFSAITSNFTYMKNAMQSPSKYWHLTALSIINILLLYYAKKHKNVSMRTFLPYAIPMSIHILFFAKSPGYDQYIPAYVPDIILCLYIATKNYKLQSKRDYSKMAYKYIYLSGIAAAAVLMCSMGITKYYEQPILCMLDTYKQITEWFDENNKSYITYNTWLCAGYDLDHNRLPYMKNIHNSTWHISAGITDIKNVQQELINSNADYIISGVYSDDYGPSGDTATFTNGLYTAVYEWNIDSLVNIVYKRAQ